VIPTELLGDFQEFIIASHAAAVGEPLSPEEVRAVIFARIAVMARGGSGASRDVFDGLIALLEHNVIPVIPSHGSVGSADLAQMASIGAVLIGKGRAFSTDGRTMVHGAEALREASLAPIRLQAKDGLALVGANSASLGLSALLHQRLETAGFTADLVAALTLEALAANLSPFSETVISARPLPGQIRSAARIRTALDGGGLAAGTVPVQSLQDPLSIRTIPQVHGVFLEHVRALENVLLIELNSPSENPLVVAEGRQILSNGNFSVLGLAIALESVRLTIAHMAIMAERRISMLVQQVRSGLPLVDHIRAAKTRTGFLAPVIIANTASALTARIKHKANPVTVMGTTVGDGVEDHNSQAYTANRYTADALDALEQLHAIEALMAIEVLDHEQAAHPSSVPRRLGNQLERVRDQITVTVGDLGGATTTDQVVDAIRTSLTHLGSELRQIVPAPMPSPLSGFEHDPQQ
jgi:histidine ammonia-lyase